jgi:hypothetical protein
LASSRVTVVLGENNSFWKKEIYDYSQSTASKDYRNQNSAKNQGDIENIPDNRHLNKMNIVT